MHPRENSCFIIPILGNRYGPGVNPCGTWSLRKKGKKQKIFQGSGFGLVPGYTTLSVRVRANIYFGAFKIKCVRTNEPRHVPNASGWYRRLRQPISPYRCSKVYMFNCNIYFPVVGQFCFLLLFTTYVLGLLPNIHRSYILIGLTF